MIGHFDTVHDFDIWTHKHEIQNTNSSIVNFVGNEWKSLWYEEHLACKNPALIIKGFFEGHSTMLKLLWKRIIVS